MNGELLGPVDQSPVPAYDRLEEEPNLDLLLSIRRDEKSPQAGSKWQGVVLKEGKKAKLSTGQKQYAAALFKHAAACLEQRSFKSLDKKTGFELNIDEAKLARQLAVLAMGDFVTYLHAAVESQGIANTARALRLEPVEVEFYLTIQPYLPRKPNPFQVPRLFPHRLLERSKTIDKKLSMRLPGGWELRRKGRKAKLENSGNRAMG